MTDRHILDITVRPQEVKILSGSFHYFRVHPRYWRTRLQQYKVEEERTARD